MAFIGELHGEVGKIAGRGEKRASTDSAQNCIINLVHKDGPLTQEEKLTANQVVLPDGLIYLLRLRDNTYKIGSCKGQKQLPERIKVPRTYFPDVELIEYWWGLKKWEDHARFVIAQDTEVSVEDAAVHFPHYARSKKKRAGSETFESIVRPLGLAERGERFFALMSRVYPLISRANYLRQRLEATGLDFGDTDEFELSEKFFSEESRR